MKKIAFILLVIGVLSSCQSVNGPMFTPATFNKDSEGVVYVYRNPGVIGIALSPLVNLDGKEISSLHLGNYLLLNMTPGKHTISITDNKNDGAAWADSENIYLNLDVKSGTEEFYRFEVLNFSVNAMQIGAVAAVTGGSRKSGLIKIENELALKELTSQKIYRAN